MKVGNIELTLNKYKEYHANRYDIYLSGDIYDIDAVSSLSSNEGGMLSYLERIAEDLESKTVDFERIYGYFRIVITDRISGVQFFFSDNLGSQRFYIDEKNCEVSDSFRYLIKGIGKDKLDIRGIAQIFAYGSAVDGISLAKDIIKTDSEYYYEIKEGRIFRHSKRLRRFCEKYTEHDLYDFVSSECNMHKDKPIAARVTGGNDSRAILASTLRAGYRPETIITGHAGNPDIPIAKEIAYTAGLDLVVIDSDEHEANWIKKSYEFFDGCFDPVLSYRQMQTITRLKPGTELLLGGVGGEFYKNYYIKPFQYRLLCRKASVSEVISRVFDHKAGKYSWLEPEVLDQISDLKKHLFQLYGEELKKENDQLSLFNHAGYYRIRSTFSDITNSLPKEIMQADPLVDPRMIRSIADKNPLLLAMSIWQRRQIHRDNPKLSDIKTDQGYSMTVKPVKLTGERIKKGCFWLSRVTARVRRKLGLKWNDITAQYWDVDYAAARDSDEWKRSFALLKECGILKKDTQEEDIPLNITGKIILIGMNIETMGNGA